MEAANSGLPSYFISLDHLPRWEAFSSAKYREEQFFSSEISREDRLPPRRVPLHQHMVETDEGIW
jgi:hypothetical protein